jgi:hypothetical protein
LILQFFFPDLLNLFSHSPDHQPPRFFPDCQASVLDR